MNLIQQHLPLRYDLMRLTVVLRQSLTEWIRQEIVDDDPYDEQASLVEWIRAQQSHSLR